VSVEADNYLHNILNREAVDTGPFSPVRGVQAQIQPVIAQWAGNRLAGIGVSGSFMKGTANRSGTDIDLFISLTQNTSETLKEVYERLFSRMEQNGYRPRRQNVSINVRANGYSVDLVPGKQQGIYTTDHSIFRRRADTWTKTNVATHIVHIRQHNRLSESRILKLWRDQKALDFPSFISS
jgi:tRNA nucleotidyltransferase (CCA-adding enzyme)